MSISALAFILGFAGLLLFAVVRHPIYGLYAYMLSFFAHPPSRWWAGDLPDIRWAYWSALITLALTAIHLLFRSSARHKDWYRQGCIWLIVSYMVWMWIQSLWSLNEYHHERALDLFQNYVVVVFLIYVLLDTRERVKTFLLLVTMGCFYFGYVAYTSAGGGGRLDGVGGPGINDASSLGMIFGIGTLIGGALYFSQSGYLKWLPAVAMPFLLNGLVLTGSRGAFLALACGGFWLYYCRPRAQTSRIFLYAFLGCAAFAYLATDSFWDRMVTIRAPVSETQETDLSTQTRIILIGKQWEMFIAEPLGGGAKTTQYLSPIYLDQKYRAENAGRSSHNTIMSVLVDQGIPGIVLWLLLAIGALRKGLTLRRLTRQRGDTEGSWLNAGLMSSLIVYFVAAQFAPFLQQEIYIWLIGATWAACSVLGKQTETGQPAANDASSMSATGVRTIPRGTTIPAGKGIRGS